MVYSISRHWIKVHAAFDHGALDHTVALSYESRGTITDSCCDVGVADDAMSTEARMNERTRISCVKGTRISCVEGVIKFNNFQKTND